MPNQLNYADPIAIPYIGERPDRITQVEKGFVSNGYKQILFGTSPKDIIEIWVYNSNGELTAHSNIETTSDILSLTTLIDNVGSFEFLNFDMGKLIRSLSVGSGRFGVVFNFFRNEVGSENEDHLYVAEISDDRAEVKLRIKELTSSVLTDLAEWVIPSVPKLEAQGLIDQVFRKSVDFTEQESVSPIKILGDADLILSNTSARIQYANALETFESMIFTIMDRVSQASLDKMAEDINNLNVQDEDLIKYISEAIEEVVTEMILRNEIDSRFNVY